MAIYFVTNSQITDLVTFISNTKVGNTETRRIFCNIRLALIHNKLILEKWNFLLSSTIKVGLLRKTKRFKNCEYESRADRWIYGWLLSYSKFIFAESSYKLA